MGAEHPVNQPRRRAPWMIDGPPTTHGSAKSSAATKA
jgi:hypothetical protein